MQSKDGIVSAASQPSQSLQNCFCAAKLIAVVRENADWAESDSGWKATWSMAAQLGGCYAQSLKEQQPREAKSPPQNINAMPKNGKLVSQFTSCHSSLRHPSLLLSKGIFSSLLQSDQPVHCDVFPCKVLIKRDVWFLWRACESSDGTYPPYKPQ